MQMADSAPNPEPQSPAEGPRAGGRPWKLKTFGSIACLVAAAFGATQFFAARFWEASVWTVSVTHPLSIVILLGIALSLVLAGVVVVFFARWRIPTRRLRESLEGIRDRQRPIEELRLPESAGGLSPLLPVLQDLCRELRGQRAHVAALELEMNQRVAKRTDALERVLSGVRAQATRDALTGLFNRRMLDESLEELVRRCHADGAGLFLLMIDLDDFKLLNDTLGHATGDDLLRAIGQLIRSSIRPDDLAFRFGGDEFIILCPGAHKKQVDALGRRLTELVDALTKPLNVPRKPRLCLGLSMLDDAAEEPSGQTLLAEADRRLYAAKSMRKQHEGTTETARKRAG